jgi:Ca2+-binding RTX toxin-like protein
MITRDPAKIALRAAVLLAVAAAALWAVASAGATHIGGATYNGTLTGSGPMSFTVSRDGSEITSLTIPGPIPGNSCTYSNVSGFYFVEIANHSFDDSRPPVYFSGSFRGKQSASGTFRIDSSGCDTGSLSWNATTTASPQECKGKPATIVARPGLARKVTGTSGKDVIVGSSKRDTIKGKGGNDTICGKGGNDTLKGGGGKDKLYGQGGKDTLVGGGGNDTCVGAGGNDSATCETEKSV